jgi:TonB family protein
LQTELPILLNLWQNALAMRAIFAALLSLAAFLAVPSVAQTSTDLPPQVDGRRIQNIQPDEMWTRVTKCVLPAYPSLALASQIIGTVDIGLCVSPSGEVANYRVLAGHPLLVNAAISAIQQWVFQPNPGPGVVTCSRVRALLRFNMDGTTTVALAHAILPDDFGDLGLPKVKPPGPMANSPVPVPKPANAPECQLSPQP